MATCGRQVCQRFLAKAPLARHLVAGKCAEDCWLSPHGHSTMQHAIMPMLPMLGCCGQIMLPTVPMLPRLDCCSPIALDTVMPIDAVDPSYIVHPYPQPNHSTW